MANYAPLEWKNNTPYSQQFGDVYFSSENGLAETQYVFIQQNRLIDRWQALRNPSFTIIETGFGTGLNFLCAWQTWLNHAPSHARLHFVSIEKYPLDPADLAKALAVWSQLTPFSTQLIEQYQPIETGWHRYLFEHGRITLTLIVGDVLEQLPNIQAQADAWFLDGFAPAKNPQMWQPELFHHMAYISHAETTFATFTSASVVKKGLLTAGFRVEKISGFGKKREMLKGQFISDKKNGASIPNHAVVIGGGIAGAATAHALAVRGVQVTLIERHAKLTQEASGNPVGVLYPRVSHLGHIPSKFSLLSYLYATHWLKSLGCDPSSFDACGVLQLGFNERELARCKKVARLGLPTQIVEYLTATQTSEIAGIPLKHSGLYFPQAGWLTPQALCQHLVSHANIQIKMSTQAIKLTRHEAGWQVWDGQGSIAEAPFVVLANAADVSQFNQSAHIPLLKVRGQISTLMATPLSQSVKTVLCSDGYFTPSIAVQHCLGATFSPDDDTAVLREADHQANLRMLSHMSTDLHDGFSQQPMNGRVAWRCATSDYLPLAGQLLDVAQLSEHPPRPSAQQDVLPWLSGLFVNAAHGAKGLTSAPYCAEIIASQICGEPLPLANDLARKLSPSRFLLRELGLKSLV